MTTSFNYNTSQLLRLRRLFFKQYRSLLFGDVEAALKVADVIETIHSGLQQSLDEPDVRQRSLIFQCIEWQARSARQWEHCKTELNRDVFESHVKSQIRAFLSQKAIL